jgi:hypothetical protein
LKQGNAELLDREKKRREDDYGAPRSCHDTTDTSSLNPPPFKAKLAQFSLLGAKNDKVEDRYLDSQPYRPHRVESRAGLTVITAGEPAGHQESLNSNEDGGGKNKVVINALAMESVIPVSPCTRRQSVEFELEDMDATQDFESVLFNRKQSGAADAKVRLLHSELEYLHWCTHWVLGVKHRL